MASRDKLFPIVGVGASAGGLEAFRELLEALPADTGMGFVFIQHMDPTRESMLVPLLANTARMPIATAAHGVRVEPNRVYVTPPNVSMSIRDGVLKLKPRADASEHHMPIDHFLTSLAEDCGSGAIGIVLSGVASDGTAGLRAIKAEGGITFAQDRESARFPGMPSSAVAAGCVDFVLPAAEIAKELVQMGRHPYIGPELPADVLTLPSAKEAHLEKIFSLMRSQCGVDLRHYKTGTVNRRILRRMVLAKCERIEQYVRHIERNPNEIQALFEDIFIHVTSFFREPEVFETLKSRIFPKMKAAAAPDGPIRIWVPGCSSGEEVYSIGIAVLEYLGEEATRTRVQIFGTDISEKDVRRARIGVYAESAMEGVSAERRRRFFVKIEGGYEIGNPLREICLLARHDLAADPPFSRLALISCRNVLIYVGPVLQERFLSVFHYALKPNGYLLLGSSESISGYSHLFATESRKARVYVRKDAPVQPLYDMGGRDYERFTQPTPVGRKSPVPLDVKRAGERIVLERYAPPGFFVDPELNVIHFQGDTAPFLKPAHGSATLQLLKLVRPDLMMPLRNAIRRAKRQSGVVRSEGVRIERRGATDTYDVEVVPISRGPEGVAGYLVLFNKSRAGVVAEGPQPAHGYKGAKGSENAEIKRLRADLAATTEFLRTNIEDQESHAAELQAANEEILSNNEELQTANEELQTAKEELQSSNEELSTVNDELQTRNRELDQSASDLNNLLAAVQIPIVLLSRDLRIRRFTPAAEKLLNLLPHDTGRRISDIRPAVRIPDLEELIREVERGGEEVEREIQDALGTWYSLRIRPYQSHGDGSEGVLIALVDITKTKRSALESVKKSEATLAAILDHTPAYVYIKDLKGRYVMVNRSYERLLNLSAEKFRGKRPRDLFPRADASLYAAHSKEVVRAEAAKVFEQEIRHANGRATLHCVEFPLRDASDAIYAVCGICSDISERKRMEEELRGLSGRLITSQEEHYRHMGREMHDVVGQKVAALGLHFGEIARKAPHGAPGLRKAMELVKTDIAEMARLVHDMARQLHPATLYELGLGEALRNECQKFSQRHGIPATFRSKGVPEKLNGDLSLCLYRVAQEGLLNAAKHSRATKVAMTLASRQQNLILRITDNGNGFDGEHPPRKGGMGLMSMQERARSAGGRVAVMSAPGSGTTVEARVPLAAASPIAVKGR